MVDEDEVMDLVDQLRFNLPEEIKQANWTVQEQQRLISEAHTETARIMSKANARAEQAVREHEILRRAEREAEQGLREARARSDQIIREAEVYALEQLQQLESHLTRTLNTVKRGVEALQSSTATGRTEGGEEEPAAGAEERMERARP
jgi:vacuolar-type H+-ATPase subunit H